MIKSGLLLALWATRLAAQNLLLTDYKGTYLPVVKARDNRPYVEIDGKLVAAEGRRFALRKVDEYFPVFISIGDLEAVTTSLDVDGAEMNYEFRWRGRLETPYTLSDVFIVLEMDTESAGKVIFLSGVGDLKPRDPTYLTLRVPLMSRLGAGHYQIHLFTKGAEVLHSELDPFYRDSVVDRMTAKRIETVENAMPKIFVGLQPEYPAALLKSRTSGHVIVSLRIGANGRVYDPTVKKASDPAFGESALAAVRMWRFLPQVKNGHAIETHADMPIDFAPPREKPTKS
jgi:TonB family protein